MGRDKPKYDASKQGKPLGWAAIRDRDKHAPPSIFDTRSVDPDKPAAAFMNDMYGKAAERELISLLFPNDTPRLKSGHSGRKPGPIEKEIKRAADAAGVTVTEWVASLVLKALDEKLTA